jgi:hypothetical protein
MDASMRVIFWEQCDWNALPLYPPLMFKMHCLGIQDVMMESMQGSDVMSTKKGEEMRLW